MIDVKATAHLLLRFRSSRRRAAPWVENAPPSAPGRPGSGQRAGESHRAGLMAWDLTEASVGA